MKLSAKTRWLLLLGLIGILALGSMVVVLIERIGEFGHAESVKGYWASLQDFVKQNGRYPKDGAEITSFFHISPEKEPVEYLAPHDDNADEVVLWWKQKTIFGVKVGITESGTIVKK